MLSAVVCDQEERMTRGYGCFVMADIKMLLYESPPRQPNTAPIYVPTMSSVTPQLWTKSQVRRSLGVLVWRYPRQSMHRQSPIADHCIPECHRHAASSNHSRLSGEVHNSTLKYQYHVCVISLKCCKWPSWCYILVYNNVAIK
jgi:hypothetical protein